MDHEQIISQIIDAAVLVKRTLGQGFLEKVYQNALAHELCLRGFKAETEAHIEVFYKNIAVGTYRADILVNRRIIVEVKVAEAIADAHQYQLVNYLRATELNYGIIINFGVTPIEIKRKFRTKK